MCRQWRKVIGTMTVVFAVASCGDALGPVITDVDLARARWLASQPSSYVFEVSRQDGWTARSGYTRITVVDQKIVDARDVKGSGEFFFDTHDTIEENWSRILSTRDGGTLAIATFTSSGVPVEWLDHEEDVFDNLHHIWIRGFKVIK
jgi:hypothetical protein